MEYYITRWDGTVVRGACSRGGVFAAYDWSQMIYGEAGKAILTKANSRSGRLKDFDASSHRSLTKVLGHYSDVQSINSEDTVTWSVFSRLSTSSILRLLRLAFGERPYPDNWEIQYWERSPHPSTGLRQHGPEADIVFAAPSLAEAKWRFVVEAKWTSDIGEHVGGATQLDYRSSAACKNIANDQFGVLVIAPCSTRYRYATKSTSRFRQYFNVSGVDYQVNEPSQALRATTWDAIAKVFGDADETQEIAAYLNWRLSYLDRGGPNGPKCVVAAANET